MGLVEITDYSASGWAPPEEADARAHGYCEKLEQGDLLFFRQPPFPFSESHKSFLLGVRQPNTAHHKNVSYKPSRKQVLGFERGAVNQEKLLEVMDSYSQNVIRFACDFLRPYAQRWQVDFASFRPIEEDGRALPIRKRNDLLHVDSFPTRPSNGNRILRIFTNLNPSQPRVWQTTDPFDVWALRYAQAAGLPDLVRRRRSALWPARRRLVRATRAVGIPLVHRPAYDEFMLRFHHYLKSNQEFQSDCPKSTWEFPPNSTWLVFTDLVPHAVLSGRYALEQTFLISREAMLLPERAPYRVLEELAQARLTE
jgi:hypothetical protein